MTDSSSPPLSASRRGGHLLVFSAFVVASCGLAYELVSAALASYLLGDSILQFSSIIGCYLFAMGVGSHLSKYIDDDALLDRFVDIELLVGLLGGLSSTALFVMFAWQTAPFRTVLYVTVFCIGVLVGTEIPLVMRLLAARALTVRDTVSRVLTFDYLGALAVSLLFPLVLAPRLGMARTAVVFGLLNASVAIYTMVVFRRDIAGQVGKLWRAAGVMFVLIAALVGAGDLVRWAERGLFGDEIIHAETSPYQRLVVTRWHDDVRLYLNGNLQFSSRDEHRYHEALVHPAVQAHGSVRRALVLGGGDGLAVRELLKYPALASVTLVDLDAAMTTLFATSPTLTQLNGGALRDPRLRIVNDDAGRWLESTADLYDVVIVDFPDPSNFGLGKLYSVPFYRLLRQHLNAHATVVVQSTSPYFAPHAYWSIVATLEAAGFATWPYHVYVPSFGEWGFVLARTQARFTPPTRYDVPVRYLNADTTAQMFAFPPDMPRLTMPANQLNDQSLVRYFEDDWHNNLR